MSRVNYNVSQNLSVSESEVSRLVKLSIDKGLEESSTIVFDVPPDQHAFTDAASAMLRVDCNVKRADGSNLAESDKVFLDRGGAHTLWSSVIVRMNGKVVSNMPFYPFSTQLSRFYGGNRELRNGVYPYYDYTWERYLGKPEVWEKEVKKNNKVVSSPGTRSKHQIKDIEKSKKLRMYTPIYSDLLQSARQYIPPNTQIQIELKRSPSHMVICSAEKDTKKQYIVDIQNVTLYLKRVSLNAPLTSAAMSTLNSDGTANLVYNKLETKMVHVPAGSDGYTWLNCLRTGAKLPNRIYIAFVASKGLFGTLNYNSTYFGSFNVSSINVRLNGQSILVDPINMDFVYDDDKDVDYQKSDAREGYLTFARLLDFFSRPLDQTSQRLTIGDYIAGNVVYCIELSKSGITDKDSTGSLDIEVTFGGEGSSEDTCLMLFTESTESLNIPHL